jgi:hypothetical protein
VNLDFVMLADAVEVDASTSKVSIAGGGITHIKADVLPFRAPKLSVVLRFFVEAGETLGVGNILELRITSPDGEPFARAQSPLEHGEGGPRASYAGEERVAIVVADLEGLVFEEAGRYTFTILLGGEPVASRTVVLVVEETLAAEGEVPGRHRGS